MIEFKVYEEAKAAIDTSDMTKLLGSEMRCDFAFIKATEAVLNESRKRVDESRKKNTDTREREDRRDDNRDNRDRNERRELNRDRVDRNRDDRYVLIMNY